MYHYFHIWTTYSLDDIDPKNLLNLPVMPSMSCFIRSICFCTLGSIFLLSNWQNKGFSETSLNASRVVFANSLKVLNFAILSDSSWVWSLQCLKFRLKSSRLVQSKNQDLIHRHLRWTQVLVIYGNLQEIAFYILEHAMNRLQTAVVSIEDYSI